MLRDSEGTFMDAEEMLLKMWRIHSLLASRLFQVILMFVSFLSLAGWLSFVLVSFCVNLTCNQSRIAKSVQLPSMVLHRCFVQSHMLCIA